MKKIFILVGIMLSFTILTGCASSEKMVYKPKTIVQPKSKSLLQGITVGKAVLGKEANEISEDDLKAILVGSLQQSNLYDYLSNGRYVLNANIKKLQKPMFGTDIKVSCYAHYSLLDLKTNRLVYDKDITSDYTSKFGDDFVATVRLNLALEGAIRGSMENLIKDLDELKV